MESKEGPTGIPDGREWEYQERIKALETEVEKWRREAETDSLTGAYNRRGLKERVPEARERDKRKENAILLVDVDNFKQVNERYGHKEGDEALKAVSAFLRDHARENDIVGRWGGEEFVIAFNGADAQDVMNKFYEPKDSENPEKQRRARIRISVRLGGEEITITLSGGVATLREGEGLEDALERADMALKRVKHGLIEGENAKDQIISAEIPPPQEP